MLTLLLLLLLLLLPRQPLAQLGEGQAALAYTRVSVSWAAGSIQALSHATGRQGNLVFIDNALAQRVTHLRPRPHIVTLRTSRLDLVRQRRMGSLESVLRLRNLCRGCQSSLSQRTHPQDLLVSKGGV